MTALLVALALALGAPLPADRGRGDDHHHEDCEHADGCSDDDFSPTLSDIVVIICPQRCA